MTLADSLHFTPSTGCVAHAGDDPHGAAHDVGDVNAVPASTRGQQPGLDADPDVLDRLIGGDVHDVEPATDDGGEVRITGRVNGIGGVGRLVEHRHRAARVVGHVDAVGRCGPAEGIATDGDADEFG